MRKKTDGERFLLRLKTLPVAIKAGVDEVNRLRDLAEKVSVTYSDMPRGGAVNVSKIEDAVIEIVSISDEIQDDIKLMILTRRQAKEIIDKLLNSDYQVVLRLKYFCQKTLNEIADEMGCTDKWSKELHGRAIVEFDKEFKKYFEESSP